ncbi:MAG: hypothetical protein QOD74_893 [Variibacter sp.]|jgi:hypothetical protein|nr:hypothetical protein [Variibacter sp.]
MRLSLIAVSAVALLSFPAAGLAQGPPPCANDLMPLRDAVQKEGLAVKAAIDKKVERAAICNQLKKFAASEAKFVKYIETNAGWCGIPGEAVQQIKGNHKRSLGLRDKACSGGPIGGAPPPAGPGLSEALGTTRAPLTLDTSKPGRGTFDTLSGNALAR